MPKRRHKKLKPGNPPKSFPILPISVLIFSGAVYYSSLKITNPPEISVIESTPVCSKIKTESDCSSLSECEWEAQESICKPTN